MADIFRVEAIDILARVDAVDEAAGIADAGQRQLDQNPVYRRVCVQPVDQGEQFRLTGARRKVVIQRADADFGRRAAFVAHVGL